MPLRDGVLGAFLLGALLALHSNGGEFERLEGDRLGSLIAGSELRKVGELNARAMLALPQALGDTRATLLVVKTDRGNLARLLLEFAFRKPANGKGAPIPVAMIERFDTFEPGRASSRVARGQGLLLFDGFQVDLDAGVVVPEGQGGDVRFRVAGTDKLDQEKAQFESLEGSTLFVPAKPIPPLAGGSGPSPGKVVVPKDVTGRYRLFSDGRWTGLLELRVDESRVITGSFRSEPNGTSYSLRGQVAVEPPNKVTFTIKFPRTEQEYEGYLWSEGKSAMAGSFVMIGKTFGFFAVREGTAFELGK